MVADHPFILQFRYSSCSDQTINGYRRTEKTVKLTRVLNTLCRSAISSSPRYAQHFWGIYTDKEFSCRFTQEGYGYPNFTSELKDFSGTNETPPIKFFPAAMYYDIDFFPGDYDVTLPDSIEKYLDKVFSLKPDHAKQFDIPSTWFCQVKDLWPRSSSSALIAVVSAIEALLEKNYESCNACGQPKFEGFLEGVRSWNRGKVSRRIQGNLQNAFRSGSWGQAARGRSGVLELLWHYPSAMAGCLSA